jgi:GNAT superfamily N-acetyltransferase
VSEHINNIRSKLGAANRTSAVYLYFFKLMAQRHAHAAATPQRSALSTNSNASLRPVDARRDVPAIAALRYPVQCLAAGCEFVTPVTETGVKDDVIRELADAHHRFCVAQDASGSVLGFSQLSQYAWNPPDKRDLRLIVDPTQRRKGIGGALFNEVIAHCAEQKISLLATSVSDHEISLRRFAHKHGFNEVHHHINFELDLTTFDSTRFDDLTERVRAVGIRLSNMAEMGNTEEAQRKLFYLNSWCATLDLPGVKDEPAWDSWEQFKQAVCNSWWYQPEGQIMAIDEQTGEWVGLCAVVANEQMKGGDTMHTGVDRRYRRDPRIGQALKLAAIQYCIRKGATKLGDNHDSRDATNLALNYSMGFTTLPSVIYLERKVA